MSRELQRQLDLATREAVESARLHSFRMWAKLHPKQQDVAQFGTMYGGLMGGNQTGKSTTGILRVRFLSTGQYPDDWEGPRSDRGLDIWFAGDRWSTLRDSIQLKMFGDLEHPGRVIPGQTPPYFTEDMIVPGSRRLAQNGGGAIESIKVFHSSGGQSTITFKTYHMGMDGVASATLDGIVIDEECDFDILQELTQRILVRDGWIMCTFTPLRGRSRYYKFLERLSTEIGTVRWVSQDEVRHLDQAKLAMMRDAFKRDPDQMEARRTGKPVMGSGLVFPYDSESIWIDWFPIPDTWPVVGGMDIGIGTPTVCLPMAIDPNTNDRFIYACYAEPGRTARENHFAIMDAFGDIGISMDMAANQRDKATAETVLDAYNKIVHGEDYRKRLRPDLWKYRTVPNRSFAVGHELMTEDIRCGRLYVLKSRPGLANDPLGTDAFRDEFEEAVWNEDGTAPKDRNKFHRLDSWRYARVGISYAKVPKYRRVIQTPGASQVVVPVWTPTPGNLRA